MRLCILASLLLLGFVAGQTSDKFCMLKVGEHLYSRSLAFFWGPQKTLDDCKNLCMIRKDCIFMDYDPDGKMCRVFNQNGVFNSVDGTYKYPANTDSYIKYPTTDCTNNAPISDWNKNKEVVTNADGVKYTLWADSPTHWILTAQK